MSKKERIKAFIVKLSEPTYEDTWKKTLEEEIYFSNFKDAECFIALADVNTLRRNFVELLVNKKIRVLGESKNKDKPLENFSPKPVIIIGTEKIIYSKSSDENEDKPWRDIYLQKIEIDPRYKYLDSNIWYYYVNGYFEDKKFITRPSIESVIDDIKSNKELYKTNVAKEFLEFQDRLYSNSFLASVGSGAHATDVTPFKFHSETEMRQEADNLKKKLKNFKWRLLILDDYANTKLRCGDEPYGHGAGPTKIDVIKDILDLNNKDNWIELLYVQDSGGSFINGFKKLYGKKEEKLLYSSQSKYSGKNSLADGNSFEKGSTKGADATLSEIYDIILIDYLLSSEGTKEYSTEIFHWIKNKGNNISIEHIRYNYDLQGPIDKFWFFPISVFSYALLEEIRQLGYTHLEDEWYLARGADPVNTPQLFRYSLFKFMQMQVNEAQPYEYKDIQVFFEKVFPPSNNENKWKQVQEQAKQNYGKFIDYMSACELLWSDKEKESLFAKSVLPEKGELNDAFWGHLHNLIFMLGHEPASEWAKMWDEFNIVEKKKRKLENIDDSGKVSYLEPIREYIIDLQKISRGLT